MYIHVAYIVCFTLYTVEMMHVQSCIEKKEHMTRIDTAPFMDNVFFVCLFEKKKKK